MAKIVINRCYGGYGLSHEAVMRYAEIKGIILYSVKKYSYYLCPSEEYDKVRAEEELNPYSPDRFKQSNALYFSPSNIERHDPVLIQVIEELGSEKASGNHAELYIVEVPAGTPYRIDEYDGMESLETKDSYEWSIA